MASARAGALPLPERTTAPRRRPATAPSRPARPARERTRQRARARGLRRSGAIAWIAVGAALLAGVVFVNLAVLRLNLRLEQATRARVQLRAEDAALQSQLSQALASGRIQQLASARDGLVQADPSTIGYINLGG